MTAGAISLHDNHVPLRHKGNGSKRLIAAAMQIKLHGGKNIALIDELEVGLGASPYSRSDPAGFENPINRSSPPHTPPS
jgi:hypothetical protein